MAAATVFNNKDWTFPPQRARHLYFCPIEDFDASMIATAADLGCDNRSVTFIN